MSVARALANIRLDRSEGWGHTQYSLEYHRPYLARRTGCAPDAPDLIRRAYDHFGFDFLWNTDDGLVDWARAGRVTDMGHAAYALDGSDQHQSKPSPFTTPEDVWAFDAVAEYGLPEREAQVRAYEESLTRARTRRPGQLTTGGYYRTIVSGAIAAFGWDMLLVAAADQDRMERVFDGFFRRTRFHMQAWAQTSAEVIIQHDDFVWTSGPFMDPRFYRRVIIPRYAELWKPLHAAGKKVLFCSDGNFMMFMEDLAAAGADGFIFEPCNDFDRVVADFGRTHCLVGSFVDCRDLTFSNGDQVQRDLDRTFARLEDCRGAIIAVGNHLPPNIPEPMLDRFFDALLSRLGRT